ncbi:type II and III secretion system protein [Fervidobacterium gondwanense DSM 13020]|uniref:Type II and III secretion system protein n=2 Tax=Fervidobacterium gondwanense TaxID=44754 RepID=A0A1M7SQA2_FERGO|nr:type II and III secretion system protein [Fervidobacterium gondwanense DSM 13020]
MEMTITPRFLYNSCVMEISLKLDGIPDANELNFETRGAILQSTVNLEYGKVYLVGSFSYDKSVQKEGGIAFLKDLPIIGSLFKSYYIESEKRYVMFLVIVARSIDLLSNMNEYVQESGVDGK